MRKEERKKYLLKNFKESNFPQFLCSDCKEGRLFLENNKTEKSFNPFLIEYMDDNIPFLFSAHIQCSNPDCKSFFVASGNGETGSYIGIDEDGIERPMDNYFLNIKFVYPSIEIFTIKEEYPEEIVKLIKDSFSLFWLDQSSAGNRIRKALEVLLDELGINRKGINKKNKEYDIGLNERIIYLGKKRGYKKISELLNSLKLLGNTGSHNEILSREDLLDAYEILEYILDEVYIKKQRKNKLKEITNNINNKYKR